MNTLIINNDKDKLIQNVIGSTLMTLGSLLLLFKGTLHSNIYYIIIGIIGFIFFGFLCIHIINTIIKSKPLLIINNDGIFDSSTAMSVGFIPWNCINGFRIEKVFITKYIAVDINNENNLVKDLPLLKKLGIKFNSLFHISQVLIYADNGDVDCAGILNLLNKHYNLKKSQLKLDV